MDANHLADVVKVWRRSGQGATRLRQGYGEVSPKFRVPVRERRRTTGITGSI